MQNFLAVLFLSTACFGQALFRAQNVAVSGGGGSCGGGYAHCRSLTIDHTKVPNTDQVNFSVLLSATEADWAVTGSGGDVQHTVTQSGGAAITIPADWIIATDVTCGTKVTGWEFEKYVTTTGEVLAWYNPGTVSHTVDTIVYACAGKSSVTTQQMTVSATWNTGFYRVLHLPSASTVVGSVSGCAYTPINTPTDTTGKVDGAVNFVAASSQEIIAGSCDMPTTPFTLSAWVNITGGGGTFQAIIGNISTNGVIEWRVDNDNKVTLLSQATAGIGTSTSAVPTSTWHHVAVTYDAVNARFYLDGVADGAPASSTSIAQAIDSAIGNGGGTELMNGSIDELEVSTVVRSADWITTEYNNTNSPSTFLAVGSRL